MPVTDRHADYDARLVQWRRVRDAVEGQDAVKDLTVDETYLPRLSWKQNAEKRYAAYKKRALWFGATGRTLEGVSGAVFRKDPKVAVPSTEVEGWLDDVTLTDIPFVSFAEDLFMEILTVGRAGVLTEMIDEAMAAETGDKQRPFLVIFRAEQITNWRTRRVGGQTMIEQIVLRETVQEPTETEEKSGTSFGVRNIDQYRVLELRPVDGGDLLEVQPPDRGGLFYSVTIWRKQQDTNTRQEEWQVHSYSVPTRREKALDFIPFVPFGPTQGDIRNLEKPPLLDLADVNYAHYRLDADYRHGLHYTALPTPWAVGFRLQENETLEIGGDTAWISEDPNARAGFLEFTGAGLNTIRDALEDMKREMAVLGARLLEEQKREAETAETTRLRQAGDESVTVRLAKTEARGLESVLWNMAWWGTMDENPSVAVEINTDLIDARMSSSDLSALLAARQAGEISQSTFLWNLKRGELLPPDRDIDDEMSLIKQEGPPPPPEDMAQAA